MKRIMLLSLICAVACQSRPETGSQVQHEQQFQAVPVAEFTNLLKDYQTWWSYHYYEINLSADFLPLDETAHRIAKEEFLSQLMTGHYITIEVDVAEEDLAYQLFKLPADVETPLRTTIKNVSREAYAFFRMEGQQFPEFEMQDLAGNTYNLDQLTGKTTLFKTWFIGCKACIAEFPELNDLVDAYEDDERFQFISLATDAPDRLGRFLAKKDFNYQVVAEQQDFITGTLGLNVYPTHIVVGADGTIQKVVSSSKQLLAYMERSKNK